jgi:hypothetical protein
VITVRREGFLGQREVPLDRLFLRRGGARPAEATAGAGPDRSPEPDQSP